MLGNIGGLFEAFTIIGGVLAYIFCTNSIDTQIVTSFKDNILDYEHEIPSLSKTYQYLKTIKSGKFQCKLFVHRILCWKLNCMKRYLWRDEELNC